MVLLHKKIIGRGFQKNMNNVLPQSSLLLGIIPALLILYIGLKGYEGYYKEKNIFLTFIAGIITGFVAALIEISTLKVGISFIVLFPVLEQLFKTILLNIRKLQEKRETVIYGLSLGLGFGSIFTPFSIMTTNLQIGDSLYLLISIVFGSFGIILFHGATGTLLGYGIYKARMPRYLILTVLLHIPITGLSFLAILYKIEYVQIGFVAYGIILFLYVSKKIMPRILSNRRRGKKRNV